MTDSAQSRSPKERLGTGRKPIGVAGAVGQSLAVGPIVSVAVFGGFLAALAGGAAGFPVLVAAVGALALAWLVAGHARRVAGAWTVYEYVGSTLGARAGTYVALLYAAALTFVSVGGSFLLLGILGSAFASAHLGFDPPWWTVTLLGMVIAIALTYRGATLSVGVQLLLAALSAVPVVILVIVVIAKGGDSGNTLSVFSPSAAHRGPDLFAGLLFALTLFQGFEAAAALGEESETPHRTIPRALLITVALAAVWYIAVVYAGTIGFGADSAKAWGADPAGLSTLANRYVGTWNGTLIALAVLLDLLAVIMATVNSAARAAFALSRDGVGPRRIARVSARHGTPAGGLALVTVASVAVLVIVAVTTTGVAGRMQAIGIMAIAGTLIVQSAYLVLVVAAVPAARASRALRRVPVIFVAAAVPVLGIYGTVHPFPSGANAWGVWSALAAVLLAGVWLLWFGRYRPAGGVTSDVEEGSSLALAAGEP